MDRSRTAGSSRSPRRCKKDDLADRDLFIVLDTSAWAQLGAMGDVAKAMREKVLVIDHHVSEDDLSDRWFKDTSAEATARIVYEIGLRLKVPLTRADRDAALRRPLDRHRRLSVSVDVSGETFPRRRPGSSTRGANPTAIYRELFEQDSLARLHLVGRTLAGARSRTTAG